MEPVSSLQRRFESWTRVVELEKITECFVVKFVYFFMVGSKSVLF